MLKVSDVRLLLYVNRFTVYIPVLCIACRTFCIILALRICSEVKDNPPVDIHQRRDWKYMDIESRSSSLVSGKSERVDLPEWMCLNGASKLGRVHQVEANANFFFPEVYAVTWCKNH